jgi:hypothetical protein
MLRAALALADVLTAHRAAAAYGALGPLSVRAFRAAVASAGWKKYAIGEPSRTGLHAQAPVQQRSYCCAAVRRGRALMA